MIGRDVAAGFLYFSILESCAASDMAATQFKLRAPTAALTPGSGDAAARRTVAKGRQ
jgi:hypothetical protein